MRRVDNHQQLLLRDPFDQLGPKRKALRSERNLAAGNTRFVGVGRDLSLASHDHENGTELLAPTMGKPKSKEERLILDDFAVNKETGEVTMCSAGEAPCEIRRGKDEGLRIYFNPASCEACEYQDYCCVGLDNECKLKYTPKQFRLAQRRVAEESEEFREKYRWRSGIEAVNANLKQKLGLGRLRVRGIEKVRLAVKLKALGWNIFQAAKAKKSPVFAIFTPVNRPKP